MSDYAHPESLVTTQWVSDHLNDPNVRLLEVGWDASEVESGHIPNAIAGWGYANIHQGNSRSLPDKSQNEQSMFDFGRVEHASLLGCESSSDSQT